MYILLLYISVKNINASQITAITDHCEEASLGTKGTFQALRIGNVESERVNI